MLILFLHPCELYTHISCFLHTLIRWNAGRSISMLFADLSAKPMLKSQAQINSKSKLIFFLIYKLRASPNCAVLEGLHDHAHFAMITKLSACVYLNNGVLKVFFCVDSMKFRLSAFTQQKV